MKINIKCFYCPDAFANTIYYRGPDDRNPKNKNYLGAIEENKNLKED